MTLREGAVLIGWSVGVTVSATVSGWIVGAATIPYGVPLDAVAVLTVVVTALVCLVGCRVAVSRTKANATAELVMVCLGPGALAVVNALLSSAMWWFRILMFVLIAAGAAAGALGARGGTGREPRADRRFSPLG